MGLSCTTYRHLGWTESLLPRNVSSSGRALGNLVSFRSSVRLVDFLYLCLKNLPPPRRECLISEEITTQHIYFPKPVFFFSHKEKFMPSG